MKMVKVETNSRHHLHYVVKMYVTSIKRQWKNILDKKDKESLRDYHRLEEIKKMWQLKTTWNLGLGIATQCKKSALVEKLWNPSNISSLHNNIVLVLFLSFYFL